MRRRQAGLQADEEHGREALCDRERTGRVTEFALMLRQHLPVPPELRGLIHSFKDE